MPHSIRHGDVLADRYRLVDLLSESGDGRFWRAHDRILRRHVALHLIDADDERAAGLLDAARRSAAVLDRRFLRVLDAEQTDGLCYVVNEWGQGTSLDIMLANDGPLGPRRAAWLVAEVADSIASAHAAGVAHGRLVPENVLVDRNGAVRVIGFAVDAALHGLPPDRASADVADLAGLLHCALTGRWAGVSDSAVPAAPSENGRVLRPRQVRAGIPRPLDALCDEVLNPYADRAGHDVDASARGIADALTDFVGDASGMSEAMAASQSGLRNETVVLSALPESPAPTDDPPTEVGLPMFEDGTEDVSWLQASTTASPPPPAFEDPPARPLFAPESTEGRPVRPRPDGSDPATGQSTAADDYWPWETGTGRGAGRGSAQRPVAEPAAAPQDDGGVPGRRWLRLAALVALALSLLVAVAIAYNVGRGRTPLGAEPGTGRSPTPSAVESDAVAPLTGLTALDLDPQGDPPREENRDLAPLAVDGDPVTAWRTVTYTQQFGPAGLKTGIGLRVDLGATYEVASVDLVLVGDSTDVTLYVTDQQVEAVAGLSPAATATLGPRGRIALDEPVSGRYVIVWLTSLPQIDGGFRGEVAEVVVRG